jgi:hypothetical protein
MGELCLSKIYQRSYNEIEKESNENVGICFRDGSLLNLNLQINKYVQLFSLQTITESPISAFS